MPRRRRHGGVDGIAADFEYPGAGFDGERVARGKRTVHDEA